jgi:RHS repeat-associated protein
MAGISDKALKTPYAENKYRFNGGNELQNKEFTDGSGLELYDATHRMYDAQIGRFWQIDPLPEFNIDLSPYSFSNNNPILFNDPLGDTTTLPTVTVTAAKPLDTQNGQVYGTQGLLSNFWSGNRVWVGHRQIGNKWFTENYEVNRAGYLTGNLAPNLLTFDAPVGEKPMNLKALFNLKNFIKGRYLIYKFTKNGLPYIGKALGSLAERYGSEEKVFQMGVEVFQNLDNLPNNAVALGVEQLVVDLNGGVESGTLANINNPTIKQIYVNEARYWLDNNVPNWEHVLKFQ